MATKAPASSPAQLAQALERPASDPATREDGACVVCEGERPPLAVLHDDPFCTSPCARRHYGVPIRGAETGATMTEPAPAGHDDRRTV
jgi:hypothetical protein